MRKILKSCTKRTKRNCKFQQIDELIFYAKSVIIIITKNICSRTGNGKEIFMKITKRVLSVLLFSALLISCLLFTVSAEDTLKAKGITDIEDVLEYFDKKDYLADNFEEGKLSGHYTKDALNSEIVVDPKNTDNMVLKVTGPAKDNKYALSLSEDAFIIAFDFYYDADMTGAYTVDLKTKNLNGEEDITFISFLRFDVKNGKLMNTVFDSALNNGEGAYLLADYEGFAPTVDTWHRVVMFFNAVEKTYSFKISTDGEQTWHTSANYTIGASSFTSLELKPYLEGRSNTDKISIYLDDVSVYSGTFERYPEQRSQIIDQTILDLEALYLADGTDSQTKMRVADVFAKLAEYEYTSENETVTASLAKAAVYVNLAYAGEVIARAAAIDTTAGYHDRVNYINESLAYVKNIPADELIDTAPGFKDDAELAAGVKAARKTFAEEKQACDDILTGSTAFIKKMKSYDSQNKSYEYMKDFYDSDEEGNVGVTKILNVDYTFAGEVEGAAGYTMLQAKADYEAFLVKYERITNLVSVFLEGTDKMLNSVEALKTYAPGDAEYEEAFGTLSEGYFIVLAIIDADNTVDVIDLDAELDESTITVSVDESDDSTTAPSFAERNKVFFDYKEYILESMALCDKFVEIMSQASAASYYTAKATFFNLAKEIYLSKDKEHNDAPLFRVKAYGIADSVAAYLALEDYIITSEKNAKAYIDAVAHAVAKIEGEGTSFVDKQTAIDKAVELKKIGDITGVEVVFTDEENNGVDELVKKYRKEINSVTAANSNLSKYTTYIESVIADSAKLVSLMADIKTANTFAERRALLVQSVKAAANCELSLEGVSEALTSFAEYKEAYETEIAAMNETHLSATVNAFATSAAAASDAEVYTATDILTQYVAPINE